MKATQLIKDDHRAVQTMFMQFNAEKDEQKKWHIAEQAMADLRTHSTLEEEILYPALRDVEDSLLVDEALDEHEVINDLMSEVEAMRNSGEFAAKFAQLSEKVRMHIAEEESVLLPDLAKSGVDGELGARIAERKRELMEQRTPATARAGAQARESARSRESPASSSPLKPGQQHVRRT